MEKNFFTLQDHTAILGGSFNPPHIGHLRIATEVIEICNPAKLFFVPNALPPRKKASNVLPSSMRETMLHFCIERNSKLAVSDIELQRSGLSYTIDTLKAFHQKGETQLLFIMGLDNLSLLPTWKEWEHIPELATIAVLPRSSGAGNFIEIVNSLWPHAEVLYKHRSGHIHVSLGKGRTILYISQPVLEISSSLIRERWLQKRNIEFFVPQSVHSFLQENSDIVTSTWKK